MTIYIISPYKFTSFLMKNWFYIKTKGNGNKIEICFVKSVVELFGAFEKWACFFLNFKLLSNR